MEPPVSKGAPERIRELRQAQTEAEQRLWRLLRHRRFQGSKFRRQHPITPYILDFYCHEARLGIEVDGGQHNDPETRRQDAARTVFLASKGVTVLRFWNHEVLQHGQAVLEQLDEALTSRKRGGCGRTEGRRYRGPHGPLTCQKKPKVTKQTLPLQPEGYGISPSPSGRGWPKAG